MQIDFRGAQPLHPPSPRKSSPAVGKLDVLSLRPFVGKLVCGGGGFGKKHACFVQMNLTKTTRDKIKANHMNSTTCLHGILKCKSIIRKSIFVLTLFLTEASLTFEMRHIFFHNNDCMAIYIAQFTLTGRVWTVYYGMLLSVCSTNKLQPKMFCLP